MKTLSLVRFFAASFPALALAWSPCPAAQGWGQPQSQTTPSSSSPSSPWAQSKEAVSGCTSNCDLMLDMTDCSAPGRPNHACPLPQSINFNIIGITPPIVALRRGEQNVSFALNLDLSHRPGGLYPDPGRALDTIAGWCRMQGHGLLKGRLRGASSTGTLVTMTFTGACLAHPTPGGAVRLQAEDVQ